MEDKKRNGRRNAEPIDLEEQYEELSEEEYESYEEEESEEEYEQYAEEESEEEYEQYAEEESEEGYEQYAEEESEEECGQYAEEESEEEADSSDENPFSEAYYGTRVRRFTPDVPPFMRNKRSTVRAGRTSPGAGAEEEADSSNGEPIAEERSGRHERRFTSDVPQFMRNRRSAAETDTSEETYENYDEYSGLDDDYDEYADEEIESRWELPFIAKAALVVLGIIGMIAGFIFLFSEPEVEESYEVGMGRAPEVVYVPVGGSVSFTVQAGEEDLAWLDEKGRVNIGVENVELTAQTEGAACTLTAAKAEDPAHRSNPQTYTVTGEASGTMIATFDLSYDRYRVSSKGEFDTVPSEVYELMPWTTVVISVYPPSAEITIPFEKVTVSAGASFELQTQVAPEDVKYAQIVYVSSNPSVAQADESGVVETFEEGTAVITAQMSDGSGTTASCTVEVLPARKLPEAEK